MKRIIVAAQKKRMSRNGNQCDSAWPKHSMCFSNQLAVAFHVLDEIECRDNIETVRREWQLLRVGTYQVRDPARARKLKRIPRKIQAECRFGGALFLGKQTGPAPHVQQARPAIRNPGTMLQNHAPHEVKPALKPPMVAFKVVHALVFNGFHEVANSGKILTED
jgi:hypothetical protein